MRDTAIFLNKIKIKKRKERNMKNFALLALVFSLLFVVSTTQSRGQLTQQSITQAQWNVLDDSTANPQNLAGFNSIVGAGSPNPDIAELGLSAPFQLGLTADVTGGWNFGTSYQFSITNNLGGAYQLSLTQGSNVYQTAYFFPTTPYTDLVFVAKANPFPPDAGIEVTNLTLNLAGSPHSLGSLSAGSIEPQLYQGFVLDGVGDNWTSITATITPLGNEAFIPNNGDFQFIISGTSFRDITEAPELSSWVMMFVGMIILFSYRRMYSSRSV
jgi:hypothetical protein